MADETREVLEQLLAKLLEEQAAKAHTGGPSFLQAESGQFLGKLTSNKYDSDSLLNKYGPFGSKYSSTSIFNPYSPYGSAYGTESVNNPYCATPPKLFINNSLIGRVTVNRHVSGGIPTSSFLYALNNSLPELLAGRIVGSESDARKGSGESYLEAADGAFLGKIVQNRFDPQSIFNQFSPYGSKFSPTSIFNQFSPYGSQFSSTGVSNRFATHPPKIFLNGRMVAYLTANPLLQPRIDPDDFLEWAQKNAPQM